MKLKSLFLYASMFLIWTGVVSFPVTALAFDKEQVVLLADSVLEGPNNTILNLTLSLQNQTEKEFQGELQFQLPTGVSVLNSNTHIRIPAKSKIYFPVRIRIGNTVQAGNYNLISKLIDNSETVVSTASSSLNIIAVRSIGMSAITNEAIMTHEGDSISIQLLLKNSGNTTETIRILSSIPSPNANQGKQFSVKELTLTSARDTLVEINYFIDRYLLSLDFFYINITGLYQNNEIFGNNRIGVQSITSNRSYINPQLNQTNWNSSMNSVELSVRNPFTDQQSLQLFGNGSFQLNNGNVNFNLNAHQWANDNKPIMNNTFLRYDQNNKGITLGNINESYERYISGRGAKLHYGDSAGTYISNIGFADKQYNLLQTNSGSNYNKGYTVFASHNQKFGLEERQNFSSTALYDRDSYENAESFLFSNNLDLFYQGSNKNTRLNLLLGGGLSRPMTQNDTTIGYKPSGAIGLVFNTNLKKYIFSSNNFYSTGYYPGNRKGILQGNQRLSRSLGKSHIWASYNFYKAEPQSFNLLRSYDLYFMFSKTELGISTAFSPFIQMTWSPRYDYEKGRYSFSGEAAEISDFANYRLNQNLSWRSRDNKHQSNISLEIGVEDQSVLPIKNTFHAKSTLSYHYKGLGLSAYLQKGAFTLVEKLSNQIFDREDPFRYGMSAYFTKSIWQEKLRTDWSLNYFSDHFSGSSTSLNGRLQYFLNQKTALFTYAQAYHYNTQFYNGMPNISFQAGIIQKLPQNKGKNEIKNGSITVFGFYDHNHNGIFDEGDEAAIDKILMLDDVIFITDSKGEINYKNVPYGKHTLSAPIEKGWHAERFSFMLGNKSETINIPLIKSGTARGNLTYIFDGRYNMEVNTSLEGFHITAISETGHRSTTRTDNQGNYVLFLPEGIYDIFLNDEELPDNVYTDQSSYQIEIIAGETNRIPAFNLKVRERRIEIKRFQSNP